MYDQDLKRKWDNAAVLAGAEERGMEKGLQQGLEQGKLAEKLEIARKMKLKEVPVEDIVELIGLSAEEIEKL